MLGVEPTVTSGAGLGFGKFFNLTFKKPRSCSPSAIRCLLITISQGDPVLSTKMNKGQRRFQILYNSRENQTMNRQFRHPENGTKAEECRDKQD